MNFTPFGDNKLETRHDVQKLVIHLFEPLIEAFSPGRARVRLEETAACFVQASADLEGFARPLWGIVPFVYGGGDFKHWDYYRTGLSNGTNPAHPEYWGDPTPKEQKMVEMAAIGYALAFVPEHIWEPLGAEAQDHILKYLLKMRQLEFNGNNWLFFRVLIDLGLSNTSCEIKDNLSEQYLARLNAMYIKDGWYGDGGPEMIDHYNAFALHFYSLLYAKLNHSKDPTRSKVFVERAHKFAKQYIRWFADDGASLAIGRSLTYRFAAVSFWGALALEGSDVPDISWGQIKGVYMRCLRWWSKRPISRFRSGILSVGFGYPQPYMYETYNSSQSPYWAMKAFSALGAPSDHPFWTSAEEPLSFVGTEAKLEVPKMIVTTAPGNSIVLSSGITQNDFVTNVSDKYGKFAYSTKFGFCISGGAFIKPWDNMIAFSYDDGRSFSGRFRSESRWFSKGLYSKWRPELIAEGVEIETYLIPYGEWHYRVHKVTTDRALKSIEGGFAIQDIECREELTESQGKITNLNEECSTIINTGEVTRKPAAVRPDPNLNLLHPLVMVPQLECYISTGTTELAALVYAGGLHNVPKLDRKLPSLEALENMLHE